MEPGRVLPGCVGLGLITLAAEAFRQHHLNLFGVALLAAAATTLAGEMFLRSTFVLGSLGTAIMAAGFMFLFNPTNRIVWFLAIPIAAVIGGFTTMLLGTAKQAHWSKRQDLRN